MRKREPSKSVIIVIKPSDHQRYKELAYNADMSFSRFVRQALAEYERTLQPDQHSTDRK